MAVFRHIIKPQSKTVRTDRKTKQSNGRIQKQNLMCMGSIPVTKASKKFNEERLFSTNSAKQVDIGMEYNQS